MPFIPIQRDVGGIARMQPVASGDNVLDVFSRTYEAQSMTASALGDRDILGQVLNEAIEKAGMQVDAPAGLPDLLFEMAKQDDFSDEAIARLTSFDPFNAQPDQRDMRWLAPTINDFNKQVQKFREQGGAFPSYAELVAEAKQRGQDIFGRGQAADATEGFGNAIKGFGGSVAGSFTFNDPQNLNPMGWGGRAALSRIGREMLGNAAIEGVAQLTGVASTRKNLGLPEVSAVEEMVYTGVGAGLFQGAAELVKPTANAVKSLFKKPVSDEMLAETLQSAGDATLRGAGIGLAKDIDVNAGNPIPPVMSPIVQQDTHIGMTKAAINHIVTGEAGDVPAMASRVAEVYPEAFAGQYRNRIKGGAELAQDELGAALREALMQQDEAVGRFDRVARRMDAAWMARLDEPALLPEPKKPQSIVEFVRSRGGIKDVGGDLKQILDRGNKGSLFLINNKRGKSLDDMAREAKAELGNFLPGKDDGEITSNDLLDALQEELSGGPNQNIDVNVAERSDVQQYNEQVIAAAQRLGIDPKKAKLQDVWEELETQWAIDAEDMRQKSMTPELVADEAPSIDLGDAWEPDLRKGVTLRDLERLFADPEDWRSLVDEFEAAKLRVSETKPSQTLLNDARINW